MNMTEALINRMKSKIEVMDAHLKGQPIEYRYRHDQSWKPTRDPVWNWEEYDYRTRPKAGPKINWDHVKQGWDYLAEDANGILWLYQYEPYLSEGGGHWLCSQGDCIRIETFASQEPAEDYKVMTKRP